MEEGEIVSYYNMPFMKWSPRIQLTGEKTAGVAAGVAVEVASCGHQLTLTPQALLLVQLALQASLFVLQVSNGLLMTAGVAAGVAARMAAEVAPWNHQLKLTLQAPLVQLALQAPLFVLQVSNGLLMTAGVAAEVAPWSHQLTVEMTAGLATEVAARVAAGVAVGVAVEKLTVGVEAMLTAKMTAGVATGVAVEMASCSHHLTLTL